jgi:hypothetical protein
VCRTPSPQHDDIRFEPASADLRQTFSVAPPRASTLTSAQRATTVLCFTMPALESSVSRSGTMLLIRANLIDRAAWPMASPQTQHRDPHVYRGDISVIADPRLCQRLASASPMGQDLRCGRSVYLVQRMKRCVNGRGGQLADVRSGFEAVSSPRARAIRKACTMPRIRIEDRR